MEGIRVVYEDEDIVVIWKKAGVVSMPARTVATKTVQDWMAERLAIERVEIRGQDWRQVSAEEYFRARAGLVHRLDKETSGLMVLAKKVRAFEKLLEAFKWRRVVKKYLALSHGLWKKPAGIIRIPLARARWDNKKIVVEAKGRLAETRYEVWEEWQDWQFPEEVEETVYRGFSLVEFKPYTGRTHQIRVHSKEAGHGIVGDYVYLPKRVSREDRKWVSHILLYAYYLEFSHPRTGEKMIFRETVDELETIIKKYLR